MVLRVLAFSDIHGHDKGLAFVREKAKEHSPDLILIAGDATDYSHPRSSLEFLDGLGHEILLVPGNMDRFQLSGNEANIKDIHGVREERDGFGLCSI